MRCLQCRHENPGTITYCQKCGKKLDMTADDIQAALIEKAQGERKESTAYHARRTLFFSGMVFAMALTFLVLSGGAAEEAPLVPSITGGAKYVAIDHRFDPPFERMLCPLEVKQP